MISFYFHIPFCTKKCPYCHFFVLPNAPHLHDLLLEGLLLEWEQKLENFKEKKLLSLYFGGGTPSLLPPSHLEKLLQKIEKSFSLDNIEITLEANPENLSSELLKTFKSLKINRLSIGVQSLHAPSLALLGRGHSGQEAKEACLRAHAVGFENISIDVMYDLPFQDITSWQKTVSEIKELPITHLSLYNLTIEPHTSFFKERKKLQFPSPQASLTMLESAVKSLEEMGLFRYEISAFCRKGFFSQHNTGYWTMRPFWGFGPSAFSYFEGTRSRNIAHLQRYVKLLREGKSPIDFSETLDPMHSLKEKIAIGLRLKEGIVKEPFPREIESALSSLENKGLVTLKNKRIALTDQGTLFYDTVASELM